MQKDRLIFLVLGMIREAGLDESNCLIWNQKERKKTKRKIPPLIQESRNLQIYIYCVSVKDDIIIERVGDGRLASFIK